MPGLRFLILPGFAAALLAQGQQPPEYGGPSILSRGLAPSTIGGGANIKFRPYLAVTGTYETGLTAVSVDSKGKLQDVASEGVDVGAGVYGYHNWRHTVLGLDYRANYRHYNQNTYYDGIDQYVTLGVSHRPSRRTQFTFRENAGMYSRNYLPLTGAGFLDPGLANIPLNELFDNRVIFGSTSADLTYMKSARLSFNIGADGYLVRRRSSALYGVTGASARGDIGYRMSRFSTIGIFYDYTHFEFTKAFGASDLQILGVLYSMRFSRNWELSAQFGAVRTESLLAARVVIDPAIAAITGLTSGLIAAYSVHYDPHIMGRLSRSFQHASLQFEYRRVVTPGNGIYLTSASEGASVGYSYTGVRKWNFGVNAGYDRYRALAQTLGQYRSYVAGAGVTRQLSRSLSLVVRADERHYNTGFASFHRNSSRFSLGFAWSPGDIPLALW